MDAEPLQTRDSNDAAWRLESFDLRAGLAFATRRPGQAQSQAQRVRDWPCLFVSPPGFSPEPVDNIAVALAATRGSFDAGLFIDGREMGFATPEDMAEFVRRAYVASAGGDGSDAPGGGDLPPPLPPEGPREPPYRPIDLERGFEDGGGRAALWQGVLNFDKQAQRCPGGQSFTASWAGIAERPAARSLANGAMQTIAELLARCPAPAAAEFDRWRTDLQTLGGCISTLGLWDALFEWHGSQLRHRLQSLGLRLPWPWLRSPDVRYLSYCIFISSLPMDLPHHQVDENYYVYPWHPNVGPRFEAFATPKIWSEALESLGALPAPLYAASMAPEDLRERASLASLLSAFVSAPRALLQLGKSDAQAALELILFASACVALVDGAGLTAGPSAFAGYGLTPLQTARLEALGRNGLRWLIEQLPTRGFEPSLEDLIPQAASLRYTDPGVKKKNVIPPSWPGGAVLG